MMLNVTRTVTVENKAVTSSVSPSLAMFGVCRVVIIRRGCAACNCLRACSGAAMAKHDKPQGGFAMGPPEVMGNMAAKKSFITVGADVLALMGMSETLAQAMECLPALEGKKQTNSVNGESKMKPDNQWAQGGGA